MKRWDARKKCPNEIVCFTPGGELLPNEIGLEVDVIQLEGHRLAEKVKKEGIRWTQKD